MNAVTQRGLVQATVAMSSLPNEKHVVANRLHSVLANENRRYVLDYFEDSTDQTATLSDLADYLVARHPEPENWSRERARIRLHHVDVPKLEAAGLLDYDARSRTVRYRGHSGLEKTDELWALVTEQREA